MEYYLSLSGDNTTGTNLANAKTTWAEACKLLKAGDKLWINDGIYNSGIDYNQIPSGLSDTSRTIIQAIHANAVIFNGVNTFGMVASIYDASAMTLDGIILDAKLTRSVCLLIGADTGGPGCHYITFQNGKAHGCRGGTSGAITQNGGPGYNDHLVFQDLEVYDNSGALPQGTHGIYLTAKDSVVQRCRVHDMDGYGIHQYNGGPSGSIDNDIIQNNLIYDCGAYGLLLGGGKNNLATNNRISRCGGKPGYGGVQIYNGSALKFDTNIIEECGGSAVYVDSTNQAAVTNNTFWLNGTDSVTDAGNNTGFVNSGNIVQAPPSLSVGISVPTSAPISVPTSVVTSIVTSVQPTSVRISARVTSARPSKSKGPKR